MAPDPKTYQMEWDASDIVGAVKMGFSYIEARDMIVGYVYLCPRMMKRLILDMPDEVEMDYIPEGIGMIRTAYIKFNPAVKENELRLMDQEKTTELKITLMS